jgi:hypothetical protein
MSVDATAPCRRPERLASILLFPRRGGLSPATRDRKGESMAEFAAAGAPLSERGVAAACDRLRVGLAEIWAILKVETRGCGFLADRRPQIVFERHVFHHETYGRFDAGHPDVSDPHPGGYGAGGVHQYTRLETALRLDRRAAFRSAAWGIGRVMGRNAELVGFADVDSMVREMTASEDAQLRGLHGYIVATGLDRALQQRDWTSFARGFNGRRFAENGYDTMLDDAFQHYTLNGTPDVRLRAAQVALVYEGCEPGPIDGVMGARTIEATRRFQRARGLPDGGVLDGRTLEALGVGNDGGYGYCPYGTSGRNSLTAHPPF